MFHGNNNPCTVLSKLASALIALWFSQGAFADCVKSSETTGDAVKCLEEKIADAKGVVFTRWGREDCPKGANLVYAGWVGGRHHTHGGSGANALCMSQKPSWLRYNDSNQDGALVYGGEYQMKGHGLEADLASLHDSDTVCAVCMVDTASLQIMVPGTHSCPSDWTKQYDGYLMSMHYKHAGGEWLCVDRTPTGRTGSFANHDGYLWYPTEAECGSLPCPPYVQNREVTCAVCTR